MQTTKPSTAGTRIISVGGGKGGVGKSLVSTNLAVTIANAGHEVVLCDLDLGAANLHLMMGVRQPKAGISALLSGDTALEEAITETEVPRLRLLAGTGTTIGAANISHARKLRIIRQLRSLRSDFVVVDVGAGVGYNALDFFELGQMRLVITTPQVTSVHDAYAFLKGAVLRTLRHHASGDEVELLERAVGSREREKVKDLLTQIGRENAALGAKIERILKHFGAYLVGNQVEHPGQERVFQAVSRMVEDFLGISLPILGYVPHSTLLSESVNDREPLLVRYAAGEVESARALIDMVPALEAGDLAPEEDLLMELVEGGTVAEPPVTPSDPALLELGAVWSAADPAESQEVALDMDDEPEKARVAVRVGPGPSGPKRKRRKTGATPKRRSTLPGMTPRPR